MWREPQPAKTVRALMTTILASLGLRDGDGGVGKGDIWRAADLPAAGDSPAAP